ncbi:MAG: rhodanese-like domain-containing protein [Hyphomicrobiaceae bacterium]
MHFGQKPAAARAATSIVPALAAALTLVVAALGALNVHQWRLAAYERQERLSATLARPLGVPGQPRIDEPLHELGSAEQELHALGMSTAEAAAIIADPQAKGFEVIDIREAPEVNMGTLSVARALRYPDFGAARSSISAGKVLLVCNNGERSSLTCQALKGMGIDCRFMVGGLGRWIAEGRPLAKSLPGATREIGATLHDPHRSRLLDTADAQALIEQEKAVIVDTRYPRDFTAGHLAGAVNIPMWQMTTPELEAAFARLPVRPVLVACYDRRSCFFGGLVGLELTRKGRDYRGLYTLPWEYVPRATAVAQAAPVTDRESDWTKARSWLAGTIDRLAAEWGYISVLVGFVLATHLLLLPFAIKAERHHARISSIALELARLGERLPNDRIRRTRAMRQLLRRNGLASRRNRAAVFVAAMLTLAAVAIGDASMLDEAVLGAFGTSWQSGLGILLAIVSAAVMGGYVHWAYCSSPRYRMAIWLGLVPFLAVVLAMLPAASFIYCGLSGILLLTRRSLTDAMPGTITRAVRRRWTEWRGGEGIISLRWVGDRSDVGMEAARLGYMHQAGIPVVDGVVLTVDFMVRWRTARADEKARLVRKVAIAAGPGPYSVCRSSVGPEGLAGLREPLAAVARDELAVAIDTVVASFDGARARSPGVRVGGGTVLVQRWLSGSQCGVLSTRSPDAPGMMLIELVEGAAQDIISGRATPKSIRFGRHTGRPIGDVQTKFDPMPLVALGRRLEERFGLPQEIEWVWDGRKVWVVQCRDIGTDATLIAKPVRQEWDRALTLADDSAEGRTVTLVHNRLCEPLPRPTPATQSLIEALNVSGGSVDLACRALGLDYNVEEDSPPLFPTLFGCLYYNEAEARRREPKFTRRDRRRIRRQVGAIERRIRGEVLPQLEARLVLAAAINFDMLSVADLVQVIREIIERFVTKTQVEADLVSIVAEVIADDERSRPPWSGRNPSSWLRLKERRIAKVVQSAIEGRSLLDYALAAPGFAEDAGALEMRFFFNDRGWEPGTETSGQRHGPRTSRRTFETRSHPMRTLKQEVDDAVALELAALRKALLALDRRFELGNRIFLLSLSEILALTSESDASAQKLVAQREAERTLIAKACLLPGTLSLAVAEAASWSCSKSVGAGSGGTGTGLSGTRVAGSRRAGGRACVIDEASANAGRPLANLMPGDVLVAPFIHPAWINDVLSVSGVVLGHGGWLSRMAVIARERNIAMVVGVPGWAGIPDGAHVTLELDGSIRFEAPRAFADLIALAESGV